MYKVFIKESSVSLTDKPVENAITYRNPKQLKDLYRELEAAVEARHVVVRGPELTALWRAWCESFVFIEAAGGVVFNELQEVLLIYRLGKWDLPKGKLETGEDPVSAAVREVMEECAIPEPVVRAELPSTYHTYELKGVPILKRTHWYQMAVKGSPKTQPQREEDITEVLWCAMADLGPKLMNSYPNIVLLLENIEAP